MGVLYTRKIDGPAVLGIWNIREDTDELLKQVTLSETEQILFSTFRSERRKRQWLAYRRLIREIISPQRYPVHYDISGKPYLAGSDWNISVTHTENYAGVIISRVVKVGIDMERITPRIDKLKEKFLSEDELSSLSQEHLLEQLTLAWCAKEAVYKLYGQPNLDFRTGIRINLPEPELSKNFICEVILPAGTYRCSLFYENVHGLLVVWAVEDGRTNETRPSST